MKKIIKILFPLIALLLTFGYVSAAGTVIDQATYDMLNDNTKQVQQAAGLGEASIGTIIASIIQAGLGLLAAIFLVLMIIAGFQWMTASGNEAQVKKAQDTIKTAVIGLVIVLAAYAITYFIFKYLPFSGSIGGVNGGPQGGGSGNNI